MEINTLYLLYKIIKNYFRTCYLSNLTLCFLKIPFFSDNIDSRPFVFDVSRYIAVMMNRVIK